MAARVLVALVVLGATGCSWGERRLAPPSTAETDSTGFLQHELDRGGRIFLARLPGGRRNVVSVVSAVGVRIARSVLSGSSDYYAPPGAVSSTGNPSAGIDIEPNGRIDPVVDVRVEHNLIERNAGPGILLALSTETG